MKKLITLTLIAFALSINAWAVTYEIFDLYAGTKKQPHFITLTQVESQITRLQIFWESKNGVVNLFDIPAEQLKISQTPDGLQIDTLTLIRPKGKISYQSPWADTPIVSKNYYNLGFSIFEGCQQLLEDEYNKCFIEISDNGVGEMAMWGSLVKRK